MKDYDAVIAGYTCVDLIPGFRKNGTNADVHEVLVPGKLIEVEGLSFVLGGVVPNTGIAMKKFEKKVFLNGLVGNDFVGTLAKEWLSKNDVADGIKTTSEAGTAFSIVLAPPGIDRIYLESPGCNKIFDCNCINYDAISKCRIFHFGYPPLLRQFFLNDGCPMAEMFSKIQKMGVITSLDFSLPDPDSESGKVDWPAILKITLPYIDIFVPSLEETISITMPEKYKELRMQSKGADITEKIPVSLIREAGRMIINSGVKILMIKAGKRGAYIHTGNVESVSKRLDNKPDPDNWNNKEFWCNAYYADENKIINSSGSGDVANAAFLSAIMDGESPEMAVKFAAIAGRNNLYCHNNYRGLASWEMMRKGILSEPDRIQNF
jgi:sugar/nucleoside kinase (ribokinase family)